MAAKDIYHNAVKNALIKDGWTITYDPLILKFGDEWTEIDLGAEQLLGAEKGSLKIAVEVKSFLGHSKIRDLEDATGQYILYRHLLELLELDRTLYLAVSREAFVRVFQRSGMGSLIMQKERLRFVIFDSVEEVIVEWKS